MCIIWWCCCCSQWYLPVLGTMIDGISVWFSNDNLKEATFLKWYKHALHTNVTFNRPLFCFRLYRLFFFAVWNKTQGHQNSSFSKTQPKIFKTQAFSAFKTQFFGKSVYTGCQKGLFIYWKIYFFGNKLKKVRKTQEKIDKNAKTQGNFGIKTQENRQNSSFRKIYLRTCPARLRKKKPEFNYTLGLLLKVHFPTYYN